MRATSDHAEYMSQTASCSRPLIAVDSGNRGSVYTAAVPVSNVPKAALAGLISNNKMKNLKHTCDVLIHLFFFVITFVVNPVVAWEMITSQLQWKLWLYDEVRFHTIDSAEEENLIKNMNEKATGEDTSNKEKVLEEPDSTKVEV
ncbi:hypothetical protein Tco_1197083, partial [Tanacetum coccineum]